MDNDPAKMNSRNLTVNEVIIIKLFQIAQIIASR